MKAFVLGKSFVSLSALSKISVKHRSQKTGTGASHTSFTSLQCQLEAPAGNFARSMACQTYLDEVSLLQMESFQTVIHMPKELSFSPRDF